MSDITLATFQAGDFNVKNLIEGLMDEDVRRARLEGGGELQILVTRKTASSVQLSGCAGHANSSLSPL